MHRVLRNAAASSTIGILPAFAVSSRFGRACWHDAFDCEHVFVIVAVDLAVCRAALVGPLRELVQWVELLRLI